MSKRNRAKQRSDRILVVDDSPTIRGFLASLLAEAGYDAVTVADGAESAIAQLGSQRFELVIADKNLEPADHDGFAVCRAARQHAAGAIACMLITGDTSIDSAARAVEEEIDAYLLKPLKKRPVLERVEQALDRVRLVRQRERARAELEQTLERLVETQRRLAESDKQASLGMLAAGVAHEINNPACFILPNLEYLKRSARKMADRALEAGAPVERVEDDLAHHERMVDRCLEGITRITQVVQAMMLFSRREPSETASAVDVNQLCSSLLDLVTHELDGRAALEVELGDVPPASGHKQRLAQVVLNLLLNARRSVMAASDDGPHTIRVTTSVEGGMVALAVEDSGPSLTSNEHALEPFPGGDMTSGPGLHLTLARDILSRFGGELRLERGGAGNRLVALIPSPQ